MSTTQESSALIVQGPTGLTVDRPAVEAMYAGIETQIAEFRYDLTTDAGRGKAASLAFGIAKKRTAIEADKKRLKEGLLAQGRAIDGAWNEIKEKLEALQGTARKPLTDWEEAEAKRTEFVQRAFQSLSAVVQLRMEDTAETIAVLLSATEEYALDPEIFRELHAQAVSAKNAAAALLKASLVRVQQEEANRIELARLRAESEARVESDRKATEAAELAGLTKEREDREAVRIAEQAAAAKLAEEQRAAREVAAIAQAAKDAEERVRHELEVSAKKEADRIEAEHQAELTEARQMKESAEARERQAKEKADKEIAHAKETARLAEMLAEKKAAEEKKLAANKKHRTAVMTAAKVALMEHAGLDEEAARRALLAISAGKIPAVEIKFS